MDALGSLDEVAGQASFHVNPKTRKKNTGRRWGVSPNIEHSKVAREKKIRPQPGPEQISVAVEIAKPTAQAAQEINDADHVTSYTEAIAVIPPRLATVLNIRYEDFDDLCGFPSGLSGKVFGPAQVKRLGIEKFFDALRGAGLRIRLEEDSEQTAKMLQRIAENYSPRQANQARMGNSANLSNKIIDGVLDYLANNKKDGLVRLNKATKEARSTLARHAANARWTQKRELRRTLALRTPG